MARSGRQCSVCAHKHLAAINAELVAGRAQRQVADQYGLSHDAIQRHRMRHLTADMPDQPVVLAPGDLDLIGGVSALRGRLMAILKRAEGKRDLRAALLATREASRLLELHGRLTGEIDSSGVKIVVQGGGSTDVRERILGKLAALAGESAAPAGRIIDVTTE
jgi:hypothetical protein